MLDAPESENVEMRGSLRRRLSHSKWLGWGKYDENKYEAIKCNQSHKRHFSFLLINFPPSKRKGKE